MTRFTNWIAGAAMAAGVVFSLPTSGMASSILVDKGSYTYDPGTKLEWLDVTQTAGLSYDDVAANNGVNFIKNGWRYAQQSDLVQFFADGDIAVSDQGGYLGAASYSADPGYSNFVAKLSNIGNLLGWTVPPTADPDAWYASVGWFGTPDINDRIGWMMLNIAPSTTGYSNAGVSIEESYRESFIANATVGSLLIRDANVAVAPLPNSLALFATAFGLIGLIGWRRSESVLPM